MTLEITLPVIPPAVIAAKSWELRLSTMPFMHAAQPPLESAELIVLKNESQQLPLQQPPQQHPPVETMGACGTQQQVQKSIGRTTTSNTAYTVKLSPVNVHRSTIH
mmetsp:Transcript_52868/g.146788  ORF Transcript_52868/g.146788 Transcript_52868/m.146788 type:complete len:106 (+) Transcript_52868:233-550(+)